jgi:hypothetical protein
MPNVFFYNENWLRQQADTPTIKMLDLWHSLSLKKLGTSIDVKVGDRRSFPFHGISTVQGEMNTAIPQSSQGNVYLALLLDSVKKVDLIVASHEIGHWVLHLQGIRLPANYDARNGPIEVLLGSLASHPSVYVLQRSLGHDPQKTIDSRAAYDIAVLSRSAEPNDEKAHIFRALMYADDLINCSKSHYIGLERILKKHPNTELLVNKIIEVKDSKDISNFEEAWSFCGRVIQKLTLGKNWRELDIISALKDQIKSASLRVKL